MAKRLKQPAYLSIPVAAMVCLLTSAAAIGIVPIFMPESYSVVTHTTSQSAAQGVNGAWIARLGFMLFGVAVVFLISTMSNTWGPIARAVHAAFGVLMVAAGVFSNRPWEPGMSFSQTEDLLHSVAATGVGFAFAIGVFAIMLGRRGESRYPRVFDILAVVASVAIPLAMMSVPDYAGLLQRGMFAIAYVWYGMEILRRVRYGGM